MVSSFHLSLILARDYSTAQHYQSKLASSLVTKCNTTSAEGWSRMPPSSARLPVTNTFLGLVVGTPSFVFTLASCRIALKQHRMPFSTQHEIGATDEMRQMIPVHENDENEAQSAHRNNHFAPVTMGQVKMWLGSKF